MKPLDKYNITNTHHLQNLNIEHNHQQKRMLEEI